MKLQRLAPRAVGIFLSISLTLPNFAWAFRREEPAETTTSAGLEDALRSVPLFSGLEEQKMAVWPLLKTLGFQKLNRIRGVEEIPVLNPRGQPLPHLPAGLKQIRRIRLQQSFSDRTRPPEGVEILQSVQNVDVTVFDLLIGKEGHLVGIFPILPGDASKEIGWGDLNYFDLSGYHWTIPEIGTPSGEVSRVAAEFGRVTRSNREAIEAYKRAMAVPAEVRTLSEPDQEYAVVRLAKENKGRSIYQASFYRAETLAKRFPRLPQDLSDKYQVIIPIYPSVYRPGTLSASQVKYYKAIRDEKFGIKKGHEILVAFSGSGIDTWIAATITGRADVFDFNPLAIANVKAFQNAAIRAGIPVRFRTKVVDAFSSWRPGEGPFGKKKYHRIIGNSPFILPGLSEEARSLPLQHRWDGVTVNQFSQFAAALPYWLDPEDGRALLWGGLGESVMVSGAQRKGDLMSEILRSAGTFKPVTGVAQTPNRLHVETLKFHEKGDSSNYDLLAYVSLPTAGLEEQKLAELRTFAVRVLNRLFHPLVNPPESQVLIFTKPKTFKFIPLAVKWGWAVAVNYDGPEAAGLEALLAQLGRRETLGPYAIGTAAARRFIQAYTEPVPIENRERALRLFGLKPWDLPRAVRHVLEITRDYLGLFV